MFTAKIAVQKLQFMKIGPESQLYVHIVYKKRKTNGMINHVQAAAQPYVLIKIGIIHRLFVKVVWKGKGMSGMK